MQSRQVPDIVCSQTVAQEAASIGEPGQADKTAQTESQEAPAPPLLPMFPLPALPPLPPSPPPSPPQPHRLSPQQILTVIQKENVLFMIPPVLGWLPQQI